MAQANIKAVITAEDKASATLQGFGANIEGVGKKIAGAMKVAAVAAGAAAAALITYSLNQFRDIQKNVAGIQALTANTAEAKRVLNDAISFVQGKPFDRLDTIGAAKQLLAFGRSANDVKDDLRILGNTVILTGAQWENVTRVYGRVFAQNRLMNDDFQILTDSGIGLGRVLQKNLGISMAELKDRMAAGTVSFDDFKRAMQEAAPDSAVQNSLNTFDNRLLSLKSSLRDVGFSILGVDFNQLSANGEPLVREGGLLDRMTDLMIGLTNAIRNPETVAGIRNIFAAFTVLGSYIGNILIGAFNVIKQGIEFLSPVFTYLGNIVNTQLMPALRNLWTQLGPLLGPVARALGGILGGVLIASILALTGILIAASRIIATFANALAHAISWAKSFANSISGAVRSVASTVSGGIQGAINTVWGFYGRFVDAGWGLMRALANGIKNAAMIPYNAAKDALGKLKNLLPGSDAKEGPLSNLTQSGKMFSETFAKGITSGSDSIRNAATNSLAVPSMGLSAQPTNTPAPNFGVTPTSTSGMGGPVHITVQAGAFMGSKQDARKYAEMIIKAYNDLTASGRATV